MHNDTQDRTASNRNLPSEIPTIREALERWLGFKLPILPAMPRTLKNLDRVGAALLDWPVAALEGKSEILRARTTQKTKVIEAITKALKNEIASSSDEQIKSLIEGLAAEYVAKLSNRASVFEHASAQIQHSPSTSDAANDVDDDWIGFFKSRIDTLGTERARMLFGKVLAGEISQPGSFSKRAITILSELDEGTAKLFRSLCSIAAVPIHISHDVRVITDGFGPAGENSLRQFGLAYEHLTQLAEAGLIGNAFQSWVEAHHLVFGVPFGIGAKQYRLEVTPDRKPELNDPQKLMKSLGRLTGIPLSKAGRELFSIIDLEPRDQYIERLSRYFLTKGFVLLPL